MEKKQSKVLPSAVEKVIAEILDLIFDSMSTEEKIQFLKDRIYIREVL